jgi:hypothetical protein
MDERFRLNKYTIRRKLLNFPGSVLNVLDPQGMPLFVVRQKGFSVRGEFRLFSVDNLNTEILSIKNRKLTGHEFEVVDTRNSETVGIIKRKPIEASAALGIVASALVPVPLHSDPFSNREWLILDSIGFQTGIIKVDTPPGPFWRKININFPKLHKVFFHEQEVASFLRENRILSEGIIVDFEPDHANIFDHRLGIAAAALIMSIRK